MEDTLENRLRKAEEREQKLIKWVLSRNYLFNNIDDKEFDKVLKAFDSLLGL